MYMYLYLQYPDAIKIAYQLFHNTAFRFIYPIRRDQMNATSLIGRLGDFVDSSDKLIRRFVFQLLNRENVDNKLN